MAAHDTLRQYENRAFRVRLYDYYDTDGELKCQKWSSHSALGEGMVNIQINNLAIEGKPNCQALERASCSNRIDLLAWKQAERITWSFIEGHLAPVS